MKEHENRVVLITGGNKGIGKGIALEFAQQGAKVVIGCNQNPEMASDTLKELNEHSESIAVQADISSPESCGRLIQETVKQFGTLDIVVNNAALQTNFSVLESTYENYKRLINVNLRAPFLLMKLAHEHLKKSGQGRFILISSVHGKRALDVDGPYAISKGGMEMLMREAAVEFAPDKITINIIAPGAVAIEGKTGDPRSMSSTLKNIGRLNWMQKYRLGRMGLPSDIAYMASYLASVKAEHITGTIFRLDGGSMLM